MYLVGLVAVYTALANGHLHLPPFCAAPHVLCKHPGTGPASAVALVMLTCLRTVVRIMADALRLARLSTLKTAFSFGGSQTPGCQVSGPIHPNGAAGSPSLAHFLSSPCSCNEALCLLLQELQLPAPPAHRHSPLNAARQTSYLGEPRFSNADGKQGLPWLCVASSDLASPNFMQYVGSSLCQRFCRARGRSTAAARICFLHAGLLVDPWCPCLPAVTQAVLGTSCARPRVGVPMLHAEENAHPRCRLVANELRTSSPPAGHAKVSTQVRNVHRDLSGGGVSFQWHNWNSALITVLALDAVSAHGRSSIGWSPILEGRSEYRSRQRACLSAQLTMPDVTVPIRGNVTGACSCCLMELCAQLIVVRHLIQNFADIQGQDCCTATELSDFLPCRDGTAGRTYPVMLMRMWDAPERDDPPNDRRKLHSELGSSTGSARMFGQIPRLEHPKSLRCIGSLNNTLAEICSKWQTRMCPMISRDSSTWITTASITVGHMRRPCRVDACAILKMADSRIVPPWTIQQKTWADEWIRGCCQLAIRTPLGSVSNAFVRRLQNMLHGFLGFSTLLAIAIMMRFAGLCRAQSMLQHFTTQRCVDCKTYRAPLHVGPAHRSEPQLCCHSRRSFADLTLHKSLPGPNSGGRTPLADENSSACRGPADTRVGTFAQTSREPHSVNSHGKPLLAKPGAWLDETRCRQPNFKLPSRRGLFDCNCVLRHWFRWLFVFAFILRVTAAADVARTHNALLVKDFAIKRAFRRARNRAREHGGTWYRGKWCTASMLERTHGSAAPQTRPATRTGHKHARTRLRVLTLNVGILSTDAYDELMTTLATQRRWDVVMLQETGWKMEKMYSTAEWHVVCSGQKDDKNSGVITMIARRLCDAEHLRFQTPKPGRILHVQITQSFQTFDVVNVYQFAWNHTVPVEVMISKRDQVWQKLGGLLAQLPKRNILILAGDFNTSATSTPRLVGRGIAGPDTVVPDQGAFVALLETHLVVALNTWGKSRHCHTFSLNERVKSQIDFVLTRCRTADSLARCASVCNTLCLFAWRGGGRHLPVEASLPAKLYLPPRRDSPSCDVAALLKARDDDAEQFRRLRLSVVDALSQQAGCSGLK